MSEYREHIYRSIRAFVRQNVLVNLLMPTELNAFARLLPCDLIFRFDGHVAAIWQLDIEEGTGRLRQQVWSFFTPTSWTDVKILRMS